MTTIKNECPYLFFNKQQRYCVLGENCADKTESARQTCRGVQAFFNKMTTREIEDRKKKILAKVHDYQKPKLPSILSLHTLPAPTLRTPVNSNKSTKKQKKEFEEKIKNYRFNY